MVTKQTILDLRSARGWSQGKLADELGVDQATVSRMERGGFISRTVSKMLERLVSETRAEDMA